MSAWTYSVPMAVPAASVAAVNQAWSDRGYGPFNLSVPLSADGSEPPTHFGGHAWMDAEMVAHLAHADFGAIAYTETDGGAPGTTWPALLTSESLAVVDYGEDGPAANPLVEHYPAWESGVAVRVGQYVRHSGGLFECIQAHTTQANWTPDVVPALFRELVQPVAGEPYPRWVAPSGAHDAYAIGDRVIHATVEGVDWVWESKIPANTTEPDRDGDFHRWWEPISTLADYNP